MHEFILSAPESGFDPYKMVERYPWIKKIKQINRIKNDENSKYRILPFKEVNVLRVEDLDELIEIANLAPTVEFKLNFLMFPRITLD
jgi:hypothetical protein